MKAFSYNSHIDAVALDDENSNSFNLFTNDDVDCDAVNVFKFEIDVTKLAVETDAVKVFKLLIEVTIDAVVTLAVKVFKFEIDVTKLPVEILAV